MEVLLKIVAGIAGVVFAISACCVDSESWIPLAICVVSVAIVGAIIPAIEWE